MTRRLLKATIHGAITASGLTGFHLSALPPPPPTHPGSAGLTRLCSWGIWHAEHPPLLPSVGIMLAPTAQDCLLSCRNASRQRQYGESRWTFWLGAGSPPTQLEGIKTRRESRGLVVQAVSDGLTLSRSAVSSDKKILKNACWDRLKINI